MEASMKKTIAYWVLFNVIVVCFFEILFYASTGSVLVIHSGMNRVIDLVALDFMVLFSLYSYFNDKNLVYDEREKEIEHKAYKASYQAANYLLIGSMMLSLIKNGSVAFSVDPSLCVSLLFIIPRLYIRHYRKKI